MLASPHAHQHIGNPSFSPHAHQGTEDLPPGPLPGRREAEAGWPAWRGPTARHRAQYRAWGEFSVTGEGHSVLGALPAAAERPQMLVHGLSYFGANIFALANPIEYCFVVIIPNQKTALCLKTSVHFLHVNCFVTLFSIVQKFLPMLKYDHVHSPGQAQVRG